MLTILLLLILAPVFWVLLGDIVCLLSFSFDFKAFKAVPLRQHFDTFVSGIFTSAIWTSFLLNVYCIVNLASTWWWYLPYATYCYFDTTPYTGGRCSSWYRNLGYFKTCANYFPLTMTKDKPEEVWKGDRPYLIGCHPHGIMSIGIILNFGTEANGISKILPNIKLRPSTLNFCCRLPFLSAIINPLGTISVDKKSIECVLSKGAGYGVSMVTGGAIEAVLSKPNVHDLVLLKRKGFFRCALKYGVYLVPTFTFGENELYSQWDKFLSPTMNGVSRFLTKNLGFSLPMFHGRGVFQQSFGFLPHRRPLHTVLGSPIICDKVAEPTDEDITKLQKHYCEVLTDLFERNKSKVYSDPESHVLRFVK